MEKKGREGASLAEVLRCWRQGLEPSWSMLLQLPNQASRAACTYPPGSPGIGLSFPRVKENQANKAVSSSGMSPSPGSREAAEQAPCEDFPLPELCKNLLFFSAGLEIV